MNEIVKDFNKFAKDKIVRTSVVDDVIKHINNKYINPYILEESTKNLATLDIFSKMLTDRNIFFGGEFDSDICNVILCQLLYLDSINNQDITIMINSPGGSVLDGLQVIDTINFIKSDVSTMGLGMSASMGAVLLSCGEKGKRFVLPHSRVMIHQPSGSYRGTAKDAEIDYKMLMRCKADLYQILAKNCNKTVEEIEVLCDRDNWFIGQEAVDLGIVDKVIINKE